MVTVTCVGCGRVTEFNSGILADFRCQGCGKFMATLADGTREEITVKCVVCGDVQNVPTNTPWRVKHDGCGTVWLPDPVDVESYAPRITDKPQTVQPIPEVSVIILCCNRLEHTVKSVAHARGLFGSKEIILVDNASADDTEKWARVQKDLTYVRNKANLGCALGRNQGVGWVRGEYILFLDNDQFVPADLIQRMKKIGTDLVGVELWEIASQDGYPKKETIGTEVSFRHYVGSGGLFLKTEVFRALGGYDERFAPAWFADTDFCFRAKLAGFTVGYLPSAGVEHVGGSTVRTQTDYDANTAFKASRELFATMWGQFLFDGKLPIHVKPSNAVAVHQARRPRVNLIADVRGWAWDYKCKQLAKYLSNDFNIEISYEGNPGGPFVDRGFDLYVSFGALYIVGMGAIPRHKRITGVTNHGYVKWNNHVGMLQAAQAVHANSMLLYNEVKQFVENCHYTPNGVDIDFFKYTPRDTNTEFTACYVGKDVVWKGVREYIVPACEKAGVKLKATMCKYNSENRIPFNYMPDFYRDVDVVLVASTQDGTPNQLLEGAAVGRTVIGNAIGNVPEFVVDGVNGFLVPLNRSAYVEKLLWLKAHRKECQAMGIQARQTIENAWSWELLAQCYGQMFWQCLETVNG